MTRAWIAVPLLIGAGVAPAAAEPIFLSRQYARCTNCHFSPTGGGLLTPYGRSLSRIELSASGASATGQPAGREHEFLYGALGDAAGPLSLGIDLRPSRLEVESGGFEFTRDFLMNAELAAAARHRAWTFYASLGRQPRGSRTRLTSFEHWIGYGGESGFGFRAGRFLPAYGVKLADHTAFNRAALGLDNDDQVYALELSYTGSRHLLQVSLGPGRADTLVEDDGEAAVTASGRWQFDLRPRVALVASGLLRDASGFEPRTSAAGLALGVAPASRLTLWLQGDAHFRGAGQRVDTLLAEAALELTRGVWLRFSPQVRRGEGLAEVRRLSAGLNLLPRTHWNVVLNYYDDRSGGRSTRTLLAQLHLYL